MLGHNYYVSINDMPLDRWRKCQEEQEFNFCRVDILKGTKDEDEYYWEKVYDSFLKEFGLGKDYLRFLELQAEIADLECDLVIDDNPFAQNLIKRLNRELKELMERPVEGDLDSCITYLSKWLGFRINPKETTVREFYKYIRDYEKEAEQMKQAS